MNQHTVSQYFFIPLLESCIHPFSVTQDPGGHESLSQGTKAGDQGWGSNPNTHTFTCHRQFRDDDHPTVHLLGSGEETGRKPSKHRENM